MTPPDPATKPLQMSPSQVETYDLCRRLWWFKSGLPHGTRLQEIPKGSSTYGTVLHAVVERWLLGDDLGRDPEGKAVDLYPEGWMSAAQEFGPMKGHVSSIDGTQADQIKRLVGLAIDQGILVRWPNRRIEHEFAIDLPAIDGTPVRITGFIDCLTHDTVIDHKTTKSMRYAKSANELRKSPQMLTYAKVLLVEAEHRGEPRPTKIFLQHNVYCTAPDDERVRKTVAEVTPAHVEEFWRSLGERAFGMIQLRSALRDPERWADAPDPDNFSGACNAYGGCNFRPICGGRETARSYSTRVSRVLSHVQSAETTAPAQGHEPQRETFEMAPTVSFAARLAASKAVASGAPAPTPTPAGSAPPTPPSAPATTPTPVSAPVEATTTSSTPAAGGLHPVAAPWAMADCTACKRSADGLRTGWNTKYKPCAVCCNRRAKAGETTFSDLEQAEIDAMCAEFKGAVGTPAPKVEVKDSVAEVSAPVAPPPETVHTEPTRPSSLGERLAAKRAEAPVPPEAPAEVEDNSPPTPQEFQAARALLDSGNTISAEGRVGKAVAWLLGNGGRSPVAFTTDEPDPAAEAAAQASADIEARRLAKKGGRPRAGFTLYVRCVPSSGFAEVIPVSGLFRAACDSILAEARTKDSAIESFYDLNAFDRRDDLAKRAQKIAPDLGAAHLFAEGDSMDFRAFLDALRPYASKIVSGI